LIIFVRVASSVIPHIAKTACKLSIGLAILKLYLRKILNAPCESQTFYRDFYASSVVGTGPLFSQVDTCGMISPVSLRTRPSPRGILPGA
jgi:hypothetical protein